MRNMSSSDEDTIIILSTQYLSDPEERLVSGDTCTRVAVGRSKKEAVIARAVVVVSLSLLTISILLVIVSLIMSHHIDQLVRDANKNLWFPPGAILSAHSVLNHTNSTNTTPGS